MAPPRPEAPILEALENLHPERSKQDLEQAAGWLTENFGVVEYGDLECAGAWAEGGVAIVQADSSLGAGVQQFLQDLLERFIGYVPPERGDEAEPVVTSADAEGRPQPEDTVPEALHKLYPEHPMDQLEAAAEILKEHFGVVEYGDLQDAGAWAEAGLSIIAGESRLSSSTRSLLDEVLGSSAGAAATGAQEPEKRAESLASGISKAFPQRPAEDAASVATWLHDNFGVAEIEDLEGAGAWAGSAVSLVAEDASLTPGAKIILQEVLSKCIEGGAACLVVEDDGGPRPGVQKDDLLVLGRLGSGSFATVHRVMEKGSERKFAFKEIDSSKLVDPTFKDQIQAEVRIHLSLAHPHVLRCFQHFEEFGNIYILLELCEGGDLYEHMQRRNILEELEAAQFFSQVVLGLHYVHLKGIMHRDIKPENIFLDKSRNVKIGDFGWSARISPKQTRECGSPAYFSPEMVAGEPYDHRVDIWAVGILLYEMLTGHSPFSSALTEVETKKQILRMDLAGAWSRIPGIVQPLLKLILCRDPDRRLPALDALMDSWLTSHIGTSAHLSAQEQERRHEQVEREQLAFELSVPLSLMAAGEDTCLEYFCDGKQGFRDYMEDRTLAVPSLPDCPRAGLFAVFDGHGGTQVADMAARYLAKQLAKALSEVKSQSEALTQAFADLDVELRRYVEREGYLLAGSTSVACLLMREPQQRRPRLLCANLGDSRAVLCRGGSAMDLSTDQKPILPAEEARITAAGGKVDAQGRISGGLNVSRAFGDFTYKERKDLPPSEQKVIAVPEILELQLEEKDEFIALGTDGIFDVLSSDQLVAEIRCALQQKKSLEATAQGILEKAVNSGDNVSLCIVKFK